MENQQKFITTDFYTAAYLLANDFKLLGINKTNPQRFCFLFFDQKNRQKLLEDFFNNQAQVEPRQFVTAIKELKSLMYNDAMQKYE